MTELISLFVSCVVVMLISFSGVFFITKKLRDWTEKNIKYLVAFSAGVFLVVSYNLIFEAVELAESFGIVLISVIAGFLIFYLIENLYPEVHCHHEDQKCLLNQEKLGAKKILIGDALHNVGDGFLLALAFLADLKLGFIAAIGIFVHEFVQEISEFFILRSSGYSNKESLTKNFLVSTTIIIGAIGGFYLSSLESFLGPFIGFAAGSFIYILAIDLIPDSVKNSHKEKKYFSFLAWALFGVMLITLVNKIIAG